MFDFLSGIFKYSYWTIIVFILLVMGVVTRMCDSVSSEWRSDEVAISLKLGNTEDAVQKMHEHFIDEYSADTFNVTKKEGVLVEKIARKCIELDDRKSAALLYEEYRRAMSDSGRRELEKYLNEED